MSREKLKRFLGIYQSSSPSYILMSSIDACMDKLEREGDEMFRVFTENLEKHAGVFPGVSISGW